MRGEGMITNQSLLRELKWWNWQNGKGGKAMRR